MKIQSHDNNNVLKDRLNDLYLMLFVLDHRNPEEIKRFKDKGLESISALINQLKK